MWKVWKCRGSILVLLAVSCGGLALAQPTPRIVGGSVVPDDRYPFMVSIYFDLDGDDIYVPGCGGTLIGSRWVLTAAHCLQDKDSGIQRTVDEIAVLPGVLDLSERGDGVLVKAQSIQVHPEFSRFTFVADLALIELSQEVSRPVISLPSAESDVPMIDEPAVVAGWGFTQEGGEGSNVLREVLMPVVSHPQCLPFYPDNLRSEANVCAGGSIDGGLDACQGDSGGPLFVARDDLWVQAGIVSYGEGCARPRVPGVYTRISSYTDWVASYVPDLRIVSSGSGSSNNGQSLDPSQLIQLTEASPSRTGSLLRGEVSIYEISGAERVDLRSTDGDADLYVFSGTRFEYEDIICRSEKTSLFDSCNLSDTPERLFASVYSYLDSTYVISIEIGQVGSEEAQAEPQGEPENETEGEPEIETEGEPEIETQNETGLDTDTDTEEAENQSESQEVAQVQSQPEAQIPVNDDVSTDNVTASDDSEVSPVVGENVLGLGSIGGSSLALLMVAAVTRRRHYAACLEKHQKTRI